MNLLLLDYMGKHKTYRSFYLLVIEQNKELSSRWRNHMPPGSAWLLLFMLVISLVTLWLCDGSHWSTRTCRRSPNVVVLLTLGSTSELVQQVFSWVEVCAVGRPLVRGNPGSVGVAIVRRMGLDPRLWRYGFVTGCKISLQYVLLWRQGL